jgi:hypothetical protein
MADNTYSIESSRDEILERMIYDITGAEVESKVEKFREEYQYKKENDSLNKLIRGVVSEEKGELELTKAAKMGIKAVAKGYKENLHPQVKRDVNKLRYLGRIVKEKVANVGNDFLDGIPLKNPNAVEKAKQIRNYKATRPSEDKKK